MTNSRQHDHARSEHEEMVRTFVASFCKIAVERVGPDTTLLGDLGIDGDDAIEFLEEFSESFRVDMSEFDVSRHFGPEQFLLWTWFRSLFRVFGARGTARQRRLIPVEVRDLVNAVDNGRWTPGCKESP